MTGLISFVSSLSLSEVIAAAYGLAVLGSHAKDNTLVYKISRYILSGAISGIVGASEQAKANDTYKAG